MLSVADDEPFILHPGEFVLGQVLEWVELPDNLVLELEGKSLALDTPVPTPLGWRTMGDLEPGDLVFDETGAPTPVVAATAADARTSLPRGRSSPTAHASSPTPNTNG